MNDLKDPGVEFAERLRALVDGGGRRTSRLSRTRAARPDISITTAAANPRRVRASDELFVDRIRRVLD